MLPEGTVTLLFTDIEGSTRLLEELGDAYAAVLDRHRTAIRDAIMSWGGVEVDTQGDACFVAFHRASDALEAAQQAQRALEIHLAALAAAEAQCGRADRAAHLYGSAEALLDEHDIALEPFERAMHERTRHALRASLGERFAEHVAVGRALGTEEAISYALEPQ